MPDNSRVQTAENISSRTVPPISVTDNSSTGDVSGLSEEHKHRIREYSGKTLETLQAQHPGLLVFPDCLGVYQDKIENEELFHLSWDGTKLFTGNVVGFFGIGSVHFQILSRFDKNEAGKPQYFLHHMLSRVFCGSMLNLPTHPDEEPIWDFLIYLFPFALKRAVRQGIFRTYRTFHRNDDHLRGAIDIPRHIRCNIPFNGKVAYRTREYSGNNHLNHLIRHTIEVLRRNPICSRLLIADEEFRSAVRSIVELTPDFNPQDVARVIAKNLRPIRHPFYTEYTLLQTICLKILRHERITYGMADDELTGIVFKAEWLWEEYLATILTDSRIRHSHNITRQSPEKITIYKNGKKEVFPDFFSDKIVMDAKYKRSDDLQRYDRFQLISYIHIRRAELGLLLYPDDKSLSEMKIVYEDGEEGRLNGGGSLGCVSFSIPQNASHYDEFQSAIAESEKKLNELIGKALQMDKIILDGNELDAITFATQNTKILVIRAARGMLGCGYISTETATKVGDALAIVSGVANYDDMLLATVKAVSPAAEALGVCPGMTGRDALLKML